VKLETKPLDLVIIGRSILSSVGNPTAELYRGLINELAQRGHRTTFLEFHAPGQKYVRDMLKSPYCEVWTYSSTDQLINEYSYAIQSADVVLMGSMVNDTDRIAEWIAEEARGITIYYDTNLSATIDHLTTPPSASLPITCATLISSSPLPAAHFWRTWRKPTASRLRDRSTKAWTPIASTAPILTNTTTSALSETSRATVKNC
jgi:hypothetical protein